MIIKMKYEKKLKLDQIMGDHFEKPPVDSIEVKKNIYIDSTYLNPIQNKNIYKLPLLRNEKIMILFIAVNLLLMYKTIIYLMHF